jgi:hypothetical protein
MENQRNQQGEMMDNQTLKEKKNSSSGTVEFQS